MVTYHYEFQPVEMEGNMQLSNVKTEILMMKTDEIQVAILRVCIYVLMELQILQIPALYAQIQLLQI